jgi:hypothetical protein
MDLKHISFIDAQVYYLEMRKKPKTETPYREDICFVELPHPLRVEDYRIHYKNVGMIYNSNSFVFNIESILKGCPRKSKV